MERHERRRGLIYASPITVMLLISFIGPLLVIATYSIMPQKAFSLATTPDFSSYYELFAQGYYKPLLWSLSMAALSVLVLFLLCWPLAYGMVRVFGKFTLVITIAVVVSLFVSENIRLFGWVLTLMKGGLVEGHLRALTGTGFEGALYNVPIIVFGLVYVYFPFMLFPLAQGIAMVPDDARQAATDLGASRWQVFREIELPLAAPGIVVGSLLTFVLAAGAMAEAKLLGGQSIIVMADEIETAFTYGQNWPLGSALAMVLIVIVAVMAVYAINRVDLDLIMGKGR